MPRLLRTLGAASLVAGVAIGTLNDALPQRTAIRSGEYWVLAGDFHVHAFPGDGTLTPFALRDEARRAGLDVIAVTNHNQFVAPRLIPWLPADSGAPMLIPGEEVTHAAYHLIAVGIDRRIAPADSVPEVAAEVHRLGGVAIAAHPGHMFSGYDDRALAAVDGTEVARAEPKEKYRREFFEAFERARRLNPHVAAIGSSDFHSSAPLGDARTYLFVREPSAKGVLDAIRAGRTVGADDRGQLFGDPSLVERVRANMPAARTDPHPWRRQLSVVLAWCGAAAMIL